MSTPNEVFENDPTGMVPTVPVVAPVAPVPAVAVVPAAPVLPEKRYEYFLNDENGRPMGGKQVIVYRTDDEFRDKLIKNQENAVRRLRQVTREKEMGTTEVDDAEKFENVVNFSPRELSADERFDLSQKLANPETASEARDLLVESAFGAKPEVLARTLNETQKFMIQQRAVDNYVEFVSTSPDYYDSLANRAALTGWMSKRNWAATVTNFRKAFQHMADQVGLLETAPEVHQAIQPTTPEIVVPTPVVPVESEPKPQVPVAPTPGLGSPKVEPQQAKRHSQVPSGLNPTVASASGSTPVDVNRLTVADLDRMPSDELKRRLNSDPVFRKAADAAYTEQERRMRARQLQNSNQV